MIESNYRQNIPATVAEQVPPANMLPMVFEFLLVKYSFGFSLDPVVFDGSVYLKAGENDVGVPFVLSVTSGFLYSIGDNSLGFVNTTVAKFMQCISAYQTYFEDGDKNSLSDDVVHDRLRALLNAIDPKAVKDIDGYWGIILQEIKLGVI